MTESQIDIGAGQAWARPRGADEHYRRLVRYMGNLTLAEFMELAETLEEDLPGSEVKREFLELLASIKTLPASVIRRVLLHPVWIYWTRSTRQIARAWRERKCIDPEWQGHLHGEDQPAFDCLRESLALFPHLALAAHLLAGKEIAVLIKARKPGYLSLPGTGFSSALSGASFPGSDVCHIHTSIRANGGRSHSLLIGPLNDPALECAYTIEEERVQPLSSSREHWLTSVKVTGGSFEIDNRDDRLLASWVSREVYAAGTEVGPAANSQIAAWGERLAEAFDVLRNCYPLLEEELSAILRIIVPVETDHSELSVSCSSRNFWGAIQLSAHPGVALAEVLAHEYRHNILNALLDADSLIGGSCTRSAEFYSPWRADRRPLVGLLHGIYSFVEVVGFYQAYLDVSAAYAPQSTLAEERIVGNTCRLQVAARELAAQSKFTAFGAELFDGLQRRIDGFVRDAVELNPSLMSSVSKEVQQQYSDWLARNR